MTIDYFNKYSMLNARAEDIDNINENTLLYQAVLILLRKGNEESYNTLLEAFKAYLEVCKQREGLYDQLPVRSNNKDDWMSHDQLTAIIRISKEFNLGIHNDIWKEIKRQHFKYNNVTPDKFWTMEGGWLHPMHLLYYGYLCGNPLWKLSYPLLLLFSVIACLSPASETSGKQLCWVKFKGMIPSIHAINTWCVNLKNGSWKNVFSIYYKDPQHPINKEF